MTTYMHLTRAELEAKLAEAEDWRETALTAKAGWQRETARARAAESREKALRDENKALREALWRIAYEPQGPSDATHAEVLAAVERIARAALAVKDSP